MGYVVESKISMTGSSIQTVNIIMGVIYFLPIHMYMILYGSIFMPFQAIIKKQGTSGLPEVHDNIDGTQSCMCCKATHAAEKVSS